VTVPYPVQESQRLRHYERLKVRFAKRERNCDVIHQVRQGNITQLFPEELDFSLSFKGSPIANFIDIVARDMAEGLAPLPALACQSGKMRSDADQKRAEVKNRVGDGYWRHSRVEIQMLKAADRFVTYGWVPIFVEPDPDAYMPYIRLEDPRGSYYELDRRGDCTVYAKRWRRSVDELAALFPEWETTIRTNPRTNREEGGETQLDLVRWVDKNCVVMFLPDRGGLQVSYYEHKLSRTPVYIAERQGEDDTPRGQFDDVIWVQVARSIMAVLALEAASIAVQAPIRAPSDMDEFPIGPHAILQADNARDIGRVNLELPQGIFAESASLDAELRVGARYPEARSGGLNASVITGKGVEALLGGFDSQIRGAQMIWREAFQQVTAICFEMDETWWPNRTKKVSGTTSGTSYEFDYTPKTDINGRYDCTVTYGFAMGLNPSQSLVAILQLEGAGLIAKSTARENLPMAIDSIQEQKRSDVEGMREALKQGVLALAQSTGQAVAQGQDPLMIIQLVAAATKALQEGAPIETALQQAYAAQKAQQQAEQQQAQQEAETQGAPQPGQPGPPGPGGGAAAPAGPPVTMQDMIAGFRGNGSLPINEFQVRRSGPVAA
jgi:hypothetical protein